MAKTTIRPSRKWLLSVERPFLAGSRPTTMGIFDTDTVAARHAMPFVRAVLKEVPIAFGRRFDTCPEVRVSVEGDIARIEEAFQREFYTKGVALFNVFVRQYALTFGRYEIEPLPYWAGDV